MAGVFDNLVGMFTGDNAKEAEAKAKQARDAGLATATDTGNQGYAGASQFLDTAKKEYDPLRPGAQSAWDAYNRLQGLAPGGQQDAQSFLNNDPHIAASIANANEMTKRNAASLGILGSGGTLQDISTNTYNLDKGALGDYSSRLMAMAGYAPQIAGAQAGVDTAQAGLKTGLADKLMAMITGNANANSQGEQNIGVAQNQGAQNLFSGVTNLASSAMRAFNPIPSLGSGRTA